MQMKLLSNKDSSVNQWIYPLEDCTYGASELLKSRGMFNVPVLDFDTDALKGKKINKAWLYLRYKTDPMMIYEISTISAPWEEGSGDGPEKPGLEGIHFDVSGKNTKWPYGLTFNRFIFGNYNSSYCSGKVEVLEDNWQRFEIDKALIYERIYERSFGFAVLDARAQFYLPYKISRFDYANFDKDVYSRESEYVPYLLVEFEEAKSEAAKIESFREIPFNHELKFDMGQLELDWEVNGLDEYCYFKILLRDENGETEAAAWDTPKYKYGTSRYHTVVKGLKPGCKYAVTLEMWDLNGKRDEKAINAVSTQIKVKPAPDTSMLLKTLPGSSVYSENVYIIDENTKVEPVTGEILHNDLDGNTYNLNNLPSYIKDGRVELKGMKGEFLAFQIVVKGADFNTPVEYKGFEQENASFDASRSDISRLWYVKAKDKWHPEVVIPLGQDISKLLVNEHGTTRDELKAGLENQEYQAYYVELYIAKEQAAGSYQGNIGFVVGGRRLDIKMKIDVLDFTMSDQPAVICDLNGYTPAYGYNDYDRQGTMDENALKYEEGYYSKIHEQRMNYNPVPYGQMGNLYTGFSPEMEGEGLDMHVKSWDEWDKRFEKYFTGEAFKNSPRSGLPITNVYLPFHENWPASIKKYYKIKVEAKDYPALVNEHYEKATSPWVDFEPEYREIFKNILKEFIRHIDEKGWQHVQFQYFFNNKYYWKDPNFAENPTGIMEGTSWWLLDEPFFRDDWRALNYFGCLLKEVQDELQSGYNLAFRADLSFCYLQFYYLDNLLKLNCTSAGVPPKQPDYLRYRKDYFGEECWVYCGLSGAEHSSMGNNYKTPIMAYLVGATGYLPWDCYGRYENYIKPAETALVYPAGRAGSFEPNISMRLKVLRRAFQDIEYLSLLQKKFNYDSEQMEALLQGAVDLSLNEKADEMGRTKVRVVYMDSVKIRELVGSLL